VRTTHVVKRLDWVFATQEKEKKERPVAMPGIQGHPMTRSLKSRDDCNTLPHTATYCDMLQRTAETPRHRITPENCSRKTTVTICDTLQQTVTHRYCDTLQHTATYCITLEK